MYTVYALYNTKHQKIYVGQTQDLSARLQMHRDKVFKGYTSKFDGDWIVIYSEPAKTRSEALKREKALKSYRGREFIKQQIPL
ncbi:endonuclease [Candidatus Wolfebacteria bacterium]|nr:MAG: endonuclease [Candidatus Wolfebacteria bacterium]